MQIRVMGTKNECETAQEYYRSLEKEDNVKYVQVSQLYANRGSASMFRVYINVEYYSDPLPKSRPVKRKTNVLPGQMSLDEVYHEN